MTAAMETIPVQRAQTTRFGELSYVETDVITFPWGLPGFSDLHRFLALAFDDQPNFVWLQSLENPAVALPCADPWIVFEDYEPKLPAYITNTLELHSPEHMSLLCIVVVTKDAQEMTMNLLAPIVINLTSNRARQVVLENSGYSAREAIPRKTALAP